MDEKTTNLPVQGRRAAQQRSKQTQGRIVQAAIFILAERGLAGLTHRAVAKRAKVSLAATTYYYKTKTDLISDISNSLMNGQFDEVEQADQTLTGCETERSVFEFVSRLTDAKKVEIAAWLEIQFEVGRQTKPDAKIHGWRQFFNHLGCNVTSSTSRSELDMLIGLLIMALSQGHNDENLKLVFFEGADPFVAWAQANKPEHKVEMAASRFTSKAKATRRRILSAAIFIMVEKGASAVNYRAIAKQLDMTPAAISYYFLSVHDLLREAQNELFGLSKSRYRVSMGEVSYQNLEIDQLIDLTTTVFFREATEFGGLNLANYGIWLEAARAPELQPMVWAAIEDQANAWFRVLTVINTDISPLNAFVMQAIYIGKLIRIVCTGSSTQNLALVRGEFSEVIKNLLESGVINGTNK